MYLRELAGREDGAPPPVDLVEERENGDFVRGLILDGTATAAHDVSDGGLLVAIAEMAIASGIGAVLSEPPSDVPAHAHWFGEDQARYVITVAADGADAVLERARAASVPVLRLGVTGGDVLMLPGERPLPIADLNNRFEAWLPAYMAGEV
jgi:phosphoribosylformylglycinamidine synthase